MRLGATIEEGNTAVWDVTMSPAHHGSDRAGWRIRPALGRQMDTGRPPRGMLTCPVLSAGVTRTRHQRLRTQPCDQRP